MNTGHSPVRVTAIETAIPSDIMPGLLLLRMHTEAGIIGHGETYYAPAAVAAMVHDWMARRLLGADALAIESHWRFLYERASNFGSRGCELRALSALDLALWDILGQVCGQPVWQLLGGMTRARVPVYNSCGGPTYGRRISQDQLEQGWPGYGSKGQPGPLEDNWSAYHAAGDLAEELLAEGYRAMKLWVLDDLAHQTGGLRVSWEQLEQALQPFHQIRQRVGMKMEIILDGHGFFHLPAALRIAQAMRPLQPLWLEDVLRMDCVDSLADFRAKAGLPVSASEMLISREDYRLVLEKRAADYIMIDPTWVGGISETKRIAQMAQAWNLPVTMHDCTGPLTLLAGLHVATAVSNVTYQETVRAHVRTFYSALIDRPVVIVDGHTSAPQGPGLGVRLLPELFDPQRPGYRRSQG